MDKYTYKKLIVPNCLSDDLREKLMEDCKPFLRRLGDQFPAYQSDVNLRSFPQFKEVHDTLDSLAYQNLEERLLPEHSWFIMSEGKEEHCMFHDHPVDYVGVYYMNSHPSFANGTEFLEDGLVEAPENSMVLFPGFLVHRPPVFNQKGFQRYSMSLNWNLKNLWKKEYIRCIGLPPYG